MVEPSILQYRLQKDQQILKEFVGLFAKATSLLLYQPLSQSACFFVATMLIAGTTSDGMCYHKHTLPSLPIMLHTPSIITYITPFGKGHLATLHSLAIFPSSTIHINTMGNL
jgi:hypothetical protein